VWGGVVSLVFFFFVGAAGGVGAENCEKRLFTFAMSLRPHGTNRFPLDGFSWNLIFDDFSKICLQNSRFVKIGQE
jgi:hypothetical protein